jgi:hypothetical protein
MEHNIRGYLRQIWDKNDWLHEGENGVRSGYSFEIQVMTVCQDILDSLGEGEGIVANIIDFSKVFFLVPHDILLMKMANSGVVSRLVVWVSEFLVGRTQKVRVEGQLSKEVKLT